MNICNITNTSTAYMPARFVNLINKYTTHFASLIQFVDFHMGNALDIPYQDTVEKIHQALRLATVLHFHCPDFLLKKSIRGISLQPFLDDTNKRVVVHFHGSPMRENFEKYKTLASQYPVLVSTPEMLLIYKNSRFFPNLIDTEDSELYPESIVPSNSLKVCHLFSLHPGKKNTSEIQACKFPIDVLEKMPLKESLKVRSHYNCIIDHFQGYYGLVSIEGMLQKQVVINGANKHTLQTLNEFFGSTPPFILQQKNTLFSCLQHLQKTPDALENSRQQGYLFMKNIWTGKKNISRLIDIYKAL